MLFLLNFGVIFLGFDIEPPLIYWATSISFAVVVLIFEYIRYNYQKMPVNLFSGSIFIFFFALIVNQCFPNFSLIIEFWVYLFTISALEMLVHIANYKL